MDEQLRKLLSDNSHYFTTLENGKVQCSLNGHCFPARFDVLSAFVSGSKFQRLKAVNQAEGALKRYEPFIVPSKNIPDMLYCTLTGQLIEKSIDAVKRHMNGKKFNKGKDRFLADDQELKPEPDLDSLVEMDTAADEADEADEAGATEGKAEASPDESPDFWVPPDDSAAAGSEEDGEPAAAGCDDDEEMVSAAAGRPPVDNDGDHVMGEDEGPSTRRRNPLAEKLKRRAQKWGQNGDSEQNGATNAKGSKGLPAAAAKQGKGSGKKQKQQKQQQKQPQQKSKAGQLDGGDKVQQAKAAKKRNPQKPPATKKQRT